MNPKRDLPESEFIHEGYKENPYPFWFWLFLIAVLMSLIWGAQSWYQAFLLEKQRHNPFLQVTNRDLSLFLWQNPQFMRVNVTKKNGYLPGFQYLHKVTLEPELADTYAIAPPELLFLYHTWDRQIRQEFPQRPIPSDQFLEFLKYAEEWSPQNWPQAPKEYADLIAALPTKTSVENLQVLPETSLPVSVRMAFQGWKNYFKQGEQINQISPTYGEMEAFLQRYPHYARNYWRNIETNYLKSSSTLSSDKIPKKELTPFLRAAFFDDQEARAKR